MPVQNPLQPTDLQILKMADQTEQGFLACCQGSKPVLESFSDIQCVFLEDSRRHCIFL